MGVDPRRAGLQVADRISAQGIQEHQPPHLVALESFYKFLAAAATELRLPITVPNPAHALFISRESADPVDEPRALSARGV